MLSLPAPEPPACFCPLTFGIGQYPSEPQCWFHPAKRYDTALNDAKGPQGSFHDLTNPAGAAVVNAIGPICQLVRGEDKIPRRYLVILPGTPDNHGAAVQVQTE
jgi:hypothetical protein